MSNNLDQLLELVWIYICNSLGSDHPFWDFASYVTEMAGTNRPSHSPVTRFTTKCDFGLSENFKWWKVKSCLQRSRVSQLLILLPQCLLSICNVSEMSYRLFKWTNNDQVVQINILCLCQSRHQHSIPQVQICHCPHRRCLLKPPDHFYTHAGTIWLHIP